jgi:ribonuclease HI
MKKKHLRSLNSIEKWLAQQITLSSGLKEAFSALKSAIELVPEDMETNVNRTLPAPLEIEHDPQALALYSDGGCRGNPGPGAFAYVVQNLEGEIIAEGVEYEVLTTNNRMELSGPLTGLNELKKILPEQGREPLLTKIKVITDSKYVVDGMKSWIKGWKSRGWKKADNKPPENLELWMALDQASEGFMQVEWMWVKGHGGHPQNEYCDQKANEVMDENSR